MSSQSEREDDSADLGAILTAVHDEGCRKIIRALSEPMTAEEISCAAEIPLSTTYRKLELLTEASLVAEGVKIRQDRQHVSQYRLAFEEISITLSEDREFDVTLSSPQESSGEQGRSLWSELQSED
jgi:DNA-binding transcriptional ArsR family regulator